MSLRKYLMPSDISPSEAFKATEVPNTPPVQPQRTGKWIPKDGRYHCDQCSGIAPKGIRWDFCPNCGAKMEGVSNETD